MHHPEHPPVKANNFDLLRIAAAVSVIIWHAYLVTGTSEREPLVILTHGQFHAGWLGVPVFFFTSGFLLFLSWERDPNFVRFIANRALRIIPGLAVVVAACAFILGPAVSALPCRQYFSLGPVYAYLLNVKLFPLHDGLPGCFAGNPDPNTINGSLWTIPLEVACYLAFVVLAAGAVIKRRVGPLALWLITAVGLMAASVPGSARDLPAAILDLPTIPLLYFSSLFWAGAFFAQYRAQIPISAPLLLLAFGLLAVASRYGCLVDCGLLAIPYVVYYAAYVPIPEWLRTGVTRCGDLSYGMYLGAFPIQQMLVHIFPLCRQPLANAAVGTIASGGYAFISWRLIESRALRLKSAAVLHGRRVDRCTVASGSPGKSRITFRAGLSVLLCLGGIALILRPSPLAPEAFHGSRPFPGEMDGEWLPYVPGEGHRWMGQIASLRLRQGFETTHLKIRAYVPANFLAVTRLAVLLDDKIVLVASRKDRAAGWLIDESIPVEKTYSFKLSRIALVFDGVHAPSPADTDQRVTAALVDAITFE